MKNQFNANQKVAVYHTDGPSLVLAGPGSGKTFVLTNRILNLVKNNVRSPEEILVITFTRAAANEMKERYLKLVAEDGLNIKNTPNFGTFHSIFFEILRDSFGYKIDSLLNKEEEIEFLKEAIKDNSLKNIKEENINDILKDIKDYKLSIEREEKFIPKILNKSLFNKIYYNYQMIISDNKRLDFNDMIFECDRLLTKNVQVLKQYQNKYKYILIDEFQDINKLQYNLVKKLCKNKNLFVVGDDDQSIYRFRGSHPKVMTDFLKDYKKAKIVNLNENYRCAKLIVKLSKLVIDNNKERFKKDLNANRNMLGSVELKSFIDSKQENEYIINLIKKYHNEGTRYSDMAILYRTNILSTSISSYLNNNKINYTIKSDNKDENKTNINRDSVNLMTFHLSKGLEFKVVFIIDANDGLIPHKKSIKDKDLETERRLFYVGMTRAKDNLHIFFTTRRFGKNYKPSRFIIEAIGGQNG